MLQFPRVASILISRYARGISTGNINNNSSAPSLVKLKKLQADFQREDGNPVWLKKGFRDRLLYCTTCVLCGLGLLMNLICIYDNAKPQSWKKQTC